MVEGAVSTQDSGRYTPWLRLLSLHRTVEDMSDTPWLRVLSLHRTVEDTHRG